MNNSKIWLVVKPTVGIPLFLSAVAVGSFAVHVAVLSNTTWVADFLAGRELGSTASSGQFDAASAPTVEGGATESLGLSESVQVTLPDGRLGRLVIEGEQARVVLDEVGPLASAEAPPQ